MAIQVAGLGRMQNGRSPWFPAHPFLDGGCIEVETDILMLPNAAMSPIDQNAWEAWSPQELNQRLRDATLPWYVAGGWALDVWHGKQTRQHEDLEFVVMRHDVDYFRSVLHDLEFFTVKDGSIQHLPASAQVPEDVWQLWGRDVQQGSWRVDLMIEPGTTDLWVYKRDRAIKMARSDAVRVSRVGIPYLAPAIVMLFKAKHRRDKDQADFERCLPKLSAQEKTQLNIWLNKIHPDHDWIANLRTA